MHLTNASNLRRTAALNPLIDFVSKYANHHDLARVRVQDGSVKDGAGRPTYGGQAQGEEKNYLVIIAINANTTYPRIQRLNRLTPAVRFKKWEDEFVMVLAHELRHISQFIVGAFEIGEELEAEVDAEVFAAKVLEQYQISIQERPRSDAGGSSRKPGRTSSSRPLSTTKP